MAIVLKKKIINKIIANKKINSKYLKKVIYLQQILR